MGSYIEVNDTLQITKEQGFPEKLDIKLHEQKPFKAGDFAEDIYEFNDKPSIRLYHAPPIRTFLVENIDGKWVYWGLVHILEVKHDLTNKTTSGKYKIIEIYSLDDIKKAFWLIDGRREFDYFEGSEK